ncbi:hypothetical protein K438DRAFT_1770710 [Mycena galopus ATCC 62051]|nr:hypothetical protein K438DRAFT_1770710 [Mycena galopus ATCC 62051]
MEPPNSLLQQMLNIEKDCIIPELNGITPMKNQTIDRHALSNIPDCLRISAETRAAIELHISSVGMECQCGVDHTQGRFVKKGLDSTRQIPWPNIGCLAFIKIITLHDMQQDGRLIAIDQISGALDHSPACDAIIEMERNPRVGLHPDLREYALSLLRKNAPISLIRSECATWAKEKWGTSPGDTSFCYILTAHDSTSLYRSYAAECSISQRSSAEHNLDRCLIHYQPHLPPTSNHFELILVTPEMQEATWKYGHDNLIIMDLTFNVCSARVLLAILIVIDHENHETRARIDKLLMRLLKEETVYLNAKKAYKAEITYFKRLGRKNSPLSKTQSSAALAFLGYLSDYVVEAKWKVYLLAGSIEAAQILGTLVGNIPRTSNHLEGFNGCIKGPMYAGIRRNGHLPRIDVWVHATITSVIPAFFEKRRTRVVVSNYYSNLRTLKPKPSSTTSPSSTSSPLSSSSSPPSSASTSFTSPSEPHSVPPVQLPYDEKIAKWLEQLIENSDDTDLDLADEDTNIADSIEIASMLAKVDSELDDVVELEAEAVAGDIIIEEKISNNPATESLSPLLFSPPTLAPLPNPMEATIPKNPPTTFPSPLPFSPPTIASNSPPDPLDYIHSTAANLNLSDFSDLSPFFEPNAQPSTENHMSEPYTNSNSACPPEETFANSSFLGDQAFFSSSSHSPSSASTCSHESPVLLHLPSFVSASPSSIAPSSPDHPSFERLNAIATSMMRLQAAHHDMATEIRFLRAAGGAEIEEQLARYISPSMRELLEAEELSHSLLFATEPIAVPETNAARTSEPQTIRDVQRPVIEKFQLQNRERRKPSYKTF